MKQGSTGLTIRELQVYHKPAVELTPKQIRLWVEQLPAANLGDSSRSTYRLLVDANQAILEPDLRLSILILIEPVALRLVDALERQFINNHISLNDKQKKIAALVQAIQTELSIGFHAVIESIIIDGVKRSSKKVLTQAIGLAIKYHGLVILRCYQLYASVPPRVWRELYLLYLLARSHEVETKPFKTGDSEQPRSAKDYFIQVVLLATANPYQLRQAEIELMWQLLPDYVSLCNLEAHAFNNQPFIFNLNSGAPPVQKALYRKKDNENCLKISVVAIIEKLKLDLTHVQENARYSARKTMVFKHLIHCWSQSTQRSFARTNCKEQIRVSIGLGATHYLLMESVLMRQTADPADEPDELDLNPQTLDAMEGSLKNATIAVVASPKDRINVDGNKNYLSTSAITGQDVWAKLYQPDRAVSQPEQEKIVARRSRDSIVRDSYKIQDCALINMSPGGYCLHIPSADLPKHAQTGEIIGFIEGDISDQHWSIGVVRWVRRQVREDYIQMGVQLLAPDAVPISIQLRNSRSEKNNYQRALLLPALTGVGQAATIVTNPLAFNLNNKVRVTEISQEYEVRLTKEISSSGSSRQFCFDRIANPNEVQQAAKPSNEPKDLDGVWDLL